VTTTFSRERLRALLDEAAARATARAPAGSVAIKKMQTRVFSVGVVSGIENAVRLNRAGLKKMHMPVCM
jgi:hypothetical protein